MIHTIPQGDGFKHELSPDCPCGPALIKGEGWGVEEYPWYFREHHPLLLAPAHPAEPER